NDPLRFGAGDVNLYRVDANDPLNFSDPIGLARRGPPKTRPCPSMRRWGGQWEQGKGGGWHLHLQNIAGLAAAILVQGENALDCSLLLQIAQDLASSLNVRGGQAFTDFNHQQALYWKWLLFDMVVRQLA